MKKIILLLLTAGFLFSAACSSRALPEGFDENEVLSVAQTAAELLSEKDFEGVTGMFAPIMSSLDAETLENNLGDLIDQLGAIKEFKSHAFTSGADSGGETFVTVILVCAHENGSATYTISVYANGELCGLYMK